MRNRALTNSKGRIVSWASLGKINFLDDGIYTICIDYVKKCC